MVFVLDNQKERKESGFFLYLLYHILLLLNTLFLYAIMKQRDTIFQPDFILFY